MKESGFIVKSNKGFFDVYVPSMEQTMMLKTRGKLRYQNVDPMVGDIVDIDFSEKPPIVAAIRKRKNELIRPKVANIDYAIIVISVKEPDFQSYLLDKYLSVLEYNEIKPIIVLTKMDLLNDEENKQMQVLKEYYEMIDYAVFETAHGKLVDQMRLFDMLAHKITAVMGQTGVGKSTFISGLSPDLSLETNEISQALGRGKHTTRIVELYNINNLWIADTPGFSSFQANITDAREVSSTFIEFYKFPCKYHDCAHLTEKSCGIKAAVSDGIILTTRYENYMKLYTEVKNKVEKYK